MNDLKTGNFKFSRHFANMRFTVKEISEASLTGLRFSINYYYNISIDSISSNTEKFQERACFILPSPRAYNSFLFYAPHEG